MPRGYSKTPEQTRLKRSESLLGKNTWAKGSKKSQEEIDKMKVRMRGSGNPFYGKKHTEETLKKLRLANKERKHTQEWKDKMSSLNKGNKRALGYKHSPEEIEKIRKASIGRHFPPKTLEQRQRFSQARKGKKATPEAIQKRREGLIRSYREGRNRNWKGGITPINKRIRTSLEYKIWRKAVFERDDYTCRFCRIKGGTLHADHIKPFAYFPELRFAIDNGRTLCINCHKTTDSYGSRARKLYGNSR